MTDESFFELHLAIFGWLPCNPLWDFLTGIGLASPRTTNNAQLVQIQALPGREGIATTHIYTHAGQERLS